MDDLPFLLAPQAQLNYGTTTCTAPAEASSLDLDGYPFSFPAPNWSDFIPAEGFADLDRAAISASRSHSEAEKRRRDRINTQLAALRRLIPKSEKMDKAALLGSVVEQVKETKQRATEMSKCMLIPTDVDEVTIFDHVDSDDHKYGSSSSGSSSIIATTNSKDQYEKFLLKVCVCCDDRPELFSELNQALKSLRLTIVDANITSLGGRIKTSFILSAARESGINCKNKIKQSLKLVLSRIAASSSSSSSSCATSGSKYCRIKSRRQRFFLPSY